MDDSIHAVSPGHVTATVIMMIDSAIGELIRRGYDRTKDKIEIVPNEGLVLPVVLTIRGREVFRIDWKFDPFGLEGRWTDLPTSRIKLGWFRRVWDLIWGRHARAS